MDEVVAKLISDLKRHIELLQEQNAEQAAKIKWFEEQFRLARQRRFGSSSERTDTGQLRLFSEAEATANPLVAEPTIEKITYKRRKRRGHRDEVLADLPVEVVDHSLPLEKQFCACCGGPLHEMSREVRREVEFAPAVLKVVEHVRPVYSCRRCENNGINTPIVTAPMPAPVIKGSLASPSLIAHIMAQKYVYAMPLYRQEQQFERMGLALSRQTQANWMICAADRWLNPLCDMMYRDLLREDILHADETTLQVLREPGRSAESESYLWLFRTGRESSRPIVLFEYKPTRSKTVPQGFLHGFKGYLHVDGYPGYQGIPGVTLAGCWAHARRGFAEALKALPVNSRSPDLAVSRGLEFCNRLFAIERDLDQLTPEERLKAREARSRPVLDAFSIWLHEQSPWALPKGGLGKAVSYCLNQWGKLVEFMSDGRLELSNNLAERSIRPIVIGRRNWLFCNTPRGATASALIYSIIETAKENGLNPFAYLCHVFEQMPNTDLSNADAVARLLPYSDSLPATCRSAR